ncbi:MAG TPA: hypothetical protein DHU59_04680 [Clostridiales bacterium]|nr:hypothetical protein [Clostridiales bacterium]
MKKTLSFLLILLLIFSSVISYADTTVKMNQDSETFKYKITGESNEWKSFNSHDEMVQACRIPSEMLSKMMTEELVDAVLDYPLLYDVHFFNNTKDAIEQLKQNSDAFYELINRKDAAIALLGRIKNKESSLKEKTIKLLLEEENLSKYIYNTDNIEILSSTATVYTPNGSAVSVIIYGEQLTQAEKNELDDYTKTQYPNATFVSSSTTNYNCHSYAWYSSSTSNKYWMPNPSQYMTDGSYKKMSSPMSSTHMYYSVGDHSAKIYDAISNVISNATVISKWGSGPVMIHKASYSPYSSSGLSVWIRN